MGCILCGSGDTHEILSLSCSVSSDSRFLPFGFSLVRCGSCGTLQKKADKTYKLNITELYSHYRSYPLTEGRDQLKSFGKIPVTRAQLIEKNCADHLPETGNALDIGTGSGSFLKVISETRPNLELSAQDIGRDPDFSVDVKKFYTCPPDKISERFSMISMIHVLEHITEPHEFLENVKGLLTENGVLLIQVPDISSNIFDTAVLDHAVHFSKASLYTLLKEHFPCVAFPDGQIAKEITVIASMHGRDTKQPEKKTVDFERYAEYLKTVSAINEPMYVFGTAPVSTFFGGYIGDRLVGFLDEDAFKQGKLHLDKKIISPLDAENGIKCILPFPQEMASNISARFNKIDFITICSSTL